MLWGGTDVVRYLIHQVRPIVVLTCGAVEVQTMIYCQRCKKANPNEADHCEACGAFLLVITRTPDSMPGESIDNTLEEHLLERISALESALVRSNERFEQLLEIAQQQATGSFYDHMMLESLTELLTEKGGIDSEELEFRWRGRVARHYEETAERERLDDRCEKIIAAYRGRFRDDFAYLVEDGIDLLAEGNAKRGLKMLESALRLDDQNVELQLIIGEYYFTQGKSGEAGTILARTLEDRPDHFRALLLLGLLNGENGEDASARARLEQALAIDSNSFAAHYGLGRLLAREGKLAEAIPHLKHALDLNPGPEMYYLLGRAYQEDGRFEMAIRSLQKAVRLDPRFDLAQYSLGLLYWQAERLVEARKHFRAAYEVKPQESRYRRAVQAEVGDELPVPPALGWATLFPKRRAKVDEARFHDLLWQDLDLVAIAPKRVK